jgi:hypothetical protein
MYDEFRPLNQGASRQEVSLRERERDREREGCLGLIILILSEVYSLPVSHPPPPCPCWGPRGIHVGDLVESMLGLMGSMSKTSWNPCRGPLWNPCWGHLGIHVGGHGIHVEDSSGILAGNLVESKSGTLWNDHLSGTTFIRTPAVRHWKLLET